MLISIKGYARFCFLPLSHGALTEKYLFCFLPLSLVALSEDFVLSATPIDFSNAAVVCF